MNSKTEKTSKLESVQAMKENPSRDSELELAVRRVRSRVLSGVRTGGIYCCDGRHATWC